MEMLTEKKPIMERKLMTFEERYGGMDPREDTLGQEEKDELIHESEADNAKRI